MTATAFGCVGNTIKLRSGSYLDLAHPEPDQFTFADIAGGLAKICRFGGQCERFYSVAEHSYHCAKQAEKDGLPVEIQRSLLLHDAAEAFIGDMVKPLKIMMRDYIIVECNMEGCIAEKFDVDLLADSIREIDQSMLIAERRRMFGIDNMTWPGEETARRLSVDFGFWEPSHAEAMFSIRAREIGIDVRA